MLLNKIKRYLTRQFIGDPNVLPNDECLEEAKYILSLIKLQLPKEPDWYDDWGGESAKTGWDLYEERLKAMNKEIL